MVDGRQVRDEIRAVLVGHGEFAHGGYPDDVAEEWAAEAFTPEEVEGWLTADVFTAEAARALHDLGVTAVQAGRPSSRFEGFGGYRRSTGYKVANRDLSAAEAADLIRGVAPTPGDSAEATNGADETSPDLLVDPTPDPPEPETVSSEDVASPAENLDEALTLQQVADLLGVQYSTVKAYRKASRQDASAFPEPDGYLGRTPWWRPSTIMTWSDARPGSSTGVGRPAAGIVLYGIEFRQGLGSTLAVYGVVSRLLRAGVDDVRVSVTAPGQIRLHTSLDLDEVVERLAGAVFRPVVTTWSTGSGIVGDSSPSSRQLMLDVAACHDDPQVADYAAAVTAAFELAEELVEQGVVHRSTIRDKAAAVRAATMRLPMPAQPWVSACVDWWRDPTGTVRYVVNAVAAGGGNAGRSDWSRVYAESVLAILDDPDRGRAWWRELLTGDGTQKGLSRSPSAFLSPFYADRGWVNPAWMVAAMEGLTRCQPEAMHVMATGARDRTWRPSWPVAGPGMSVFAPHCDGIETHATGLFRLPKPGQRVDAGTFVGWLSTRALPPGGLRTIDMQPDQAPWRTELCRPRDRVARFHLGTRGPVAVADYCDIWPGIGPDNS